MTAIAKQTIRYERKREAILDAAATLFNARGLGGTIIADVAQSVRPPSDVARSLPPPPPRG